MSRINPSYIDEETFHTDVDYVESLWQRQKVGNIDMPIIDIGSGKAVVFVPILEHLEFVYTRQLRALSQTHRTIMYRRHETRTRPLGLAERAEELRQVLDSLELASADFVAHGDAAMVLFEFATRYPQRCRSLVIVAQGADYVIAPHPFIWLLHELFVRLPVEHFLPAWFLRRTVINYIIASSAAAAHTRALPCVPRHLIEEQFRKIQQWPFVYKFSVLPIIHYYDMRQHLSTLTMPILLINRFDDALAPEAKTHWLSKQLSHCNYHVIPGGERFFMYSQAETVTQLITQFLAAKAIRS
ncbi:MAG: hypothetical protein NVS4B7_01800 [Ktedonobacteraceae bacterium]